VEDRAAVASQRWALAFEVVNACSWSAVLGTPMILLLKSQGASGTVLGVALALLPLTQALQMVGARLLPRYGYRGLMVRGWTARTALVGVIAAVAFCAPALGPSATIVLTLGLLAGFTVLRGLASCAWMPWITQLVPAERRGRFIAASGMLIQGTTVVCNLGYALVLDRLPAPFGAAVLLVWSCLTGFLAAWTMARIRDCSVEAEGGSGPVPWRTMLAHRPFARLVLFALMACTALAALGVLWVPVMRDLHHRDDGFIALLPVWAGVAYLAVLPLLGRLVDRTGSRPLLGLALVTWSLHALLWAALAAGWLPLSWWVLGLIQLTAGSGSAAFYLGGQRLLMATVPGQGRSHFFALHSLALAAGQGLSPVLWGLALDACAPWAGWAGLGLNAHAALYLVSAGLMAGCLVLCARLEEPQAMGTTQFLSALLVRTPARALARLTGFMDGR
jgi:MFS family permease